MYILELYAGDCGRVVRTRADNGRRRGMARRTTASNEHKGFKQGAQHGGALRGHAGTARIQ